MNNFNAQEYFDQNYSDKDIEKIDEGFTGDKMTGELTIRDYPNLEEISLPNHQLTSLTIANCPNLKGINVRGNRLSKLEINRTKIDAENNPITNEIKEVIAGVNELTALDLTNCDKLEKLFLPD